MVNERNMLGIKSRSSEQIAKAGLTLGVGYLVLPFIPFKRASHYKPFIKEEK